MEIFDRPKKNVVVLKTRVDGPFASEQTIYLCGTSHVSKKSWEDVREIIQAVKPQVSASGPITLMYARLFQLVKATQGLLALLCMSSDSRVADALISPVCLISVNMPDGR